MSTIMSGLPTPFTFSQSSLQDYVDCARRFQLRYIEQLTWPAVETEPVTENEQRQLEGQIFHRLVQQRLLGLPEDKLAGLANTPDLQRWWQNFTSWAVELDGRKRLNPELLLSCPVGAHRLLAKFDLVAIEDDKAVIYDWKTYTKRPRDEWLAARWQTRVYRALLVQAGARLNNSQPFPPDQIEMIYWFADFPSEPARFKYSTEQFKRDWAAIEKVVTEISRAADSPAPLAPGFPMTEDEKMCRFCVYRSYCERGREAGGWQDAEVQPEAEAAFDINFEQIGEIEF